MSIAHTGKTGLVFQVNFLKLHSVNVIRGLNNNNRPGFNLSLFVK